jgi:hypothetical protein
MSKVHVEHYAECLEYVLDKNKTGGKWILGIYWENRVICNSKQWT